MENLESKSKESLLSGLPQNTYHNANSFSSTMEWIKEADENLGNDKNNEVSQDYHFFSTNFDENIIIRERQFTVNSSYLQSNLVVTEDSEMLEPKIKLGFTSRTNFMIGCFMLFLMVVPGSIIGPLTINLAAKNAYIKTSWRYQG